uniref:Glutathione S-transferase zeta class-like n=1 Tax=Cucumis melo TaxID=3656 RepID=A0A9I9CNC4_CUCME
MDFQSHALYNAYLTSVFAIAEMLRRFVNVFEPGSLFFLAELLLVACPLCVKPQRFFFFFFDFSGKFISDFEVQKNSEMFSPTVCLGLSYEYRAVDLGRREQLNPDFERLNPLKYVPVLVDGPVVVSDSYAILLYLEEKYPQKALLPTDLRLKSLHLQGNHVAGGKYSQLKHTTSYYVGIAGRFHLHTIYLHIYIPKKTIGEKFGPEEPLPWAQSTLEKGFNALEKLLKDFSGQYALGDEADVFLAPQISSAIENFGIDMSKFPTLARIYESYKTLPEFQASSPERQLDALH